MARCKSAPQCLKERKIWHLVDYKAHYFQWNWRACPMSDFGIKLIGYFYPFQAKPIL